MIAERFALEALGSGLKAIGRRGVFGRTVLGGSFLFALLQIEQVEFKKAAAFLDAWRGGGLERRLQ